MNSQKVASQICVSDLRQLSQYQAVVYVTSQVYTATQVSDYCHASGIPFVLAQTHGLAGRIFCDFGNEFTVYDVDGERIEDYVVSEFMIDQNGDSFDIFAGTKDALPYEDGQLVRVTDIKYMVQDVQGVEQPMAAEELGRLFNDRTYRIRVSGLRMVQLLLCESDIKFTNKLKEVMQQKLQVSYLRGGYLTRVKESATISFMSLSDCYKTGHITFPENMNDFVKLGQNEVFSLVYQFLDS